MAGVNGISGAGWAVDQKMIKDKLTDGKKLSVGLEAN